jgi:hypothetical protein
MGEKNYNDLNEIVIAIIDDAGLDEDLYTIINRGTEVFVDFNEKSFAEYLIKVSCDKDWTDQVAAAYSQWKKLHRVTFILW